MAEHAAIVARQDAARDDLDQVEVDPGP